MSLIIIPAETLAAGYFAATGKPYVPRPRPSRAES